jgi:hypothetical protein
MYNGIGVFRVVAVLDAIYEGPMECGRSAEKVVFEPY